MNEPGYYVERDEGGNIVALFSREQSFAQTYLPADHPDVVEFLEGLS
jgi:hypothetical protein